MTQARTVSLIIFLLLILVAPGRAAADDWGRLREETEGIQSIRGRFVQTKAMPILVTPLVSKGRFLFQAPDRVRWEYESPIQVASLVRGGHVKRYTYVEGEGWVLDSSRRVEAMRVVMEKIGGWLSGAFRDDETFEAALLPGPPRTVRLTPKDESVRNFVRRVDLVFSELPGVVGTVRIDEGPETSTTIVFEEVELNGEIPASRFEVVE